jgi:hypothetical protein
MVSMSTPRKACFFRETYIERDGAMDLVAKVHRWKAVVMDGGAVG